MATVSEILNIASKVSGLRAENAELDVALMAMNRAYLRACLDCELTGTDVSYTTTSTAETVAASSVAGAPVMRVQHLRLESAQVQVPVQQVSRQELQDYRAADNNTANGIPAMYSVSYVGGTPTIDFYPDVAQGDVIKMSYLAVPLQLATATSTAATTTPSYMPELFHHDIITNAAIAALIERDGRAEDASMWNARSLEAIVRLEEYLGQMGGQANRAYVGPTVGRAYFPDSRRR